MWKIVATERYRDLNSAVPACISIIIYRLVTSLVPCAVLLLPCVTHTRIQLGPRLGPHTRKYNVDGILQLLCCLLVYFGSSRTIIDPYPVVVHLQAHPFGAVDRDRRILYVCAVCTTSYPTLFTFCRNCRGASRTLLTLDVVHFRFPSSSSFHLKK